MPSDSLTRLDTNLSKISENGDVVLLAEVTAVDNYQAYQLPNNVKISDFRFIYETLYAPDDITQIWATDIIPVPIFKSGIALLTQFNSGTWYYSSVKYNTDTTILAYKRSNASSLKCVVYGIK